MTNADNAGWPREIRTPPTDPALAAEAALNPGGSVAEINGDMVGGEANGYVPAEAIRGAWIVGPDGKLTGEYASNPHHGTPTDDFSRLTGQLLPRGVGRAARRGRSAPGDAALAMTFELIQAAQERWRAVNAHHLVALVRAGARFERGGLLEREQVTAA